MRHTSALAIPQVAVTKRTRLNHMIHLVAHWRLDSRRMRQYCEKYCHRHLVSGSQPLCSSAPSLALALSINSRLVNGPSTVAHTMHRASRGAAPTALERFARVLKHTVVQLFTNPSPRAASNSGPRVKAGARVGRDAQGLNHGQG